MNYTNGSADITLMNAFRLLLSAEKKAQEIMEDNEEHVIGQYYADMWIHPSYFKVDSSTRTSLDNRMSFLVDFNKRLLNKENAGKIAYLFTYTNPDEEVIFFALSDSDLIARFERIAKEMLGEVCFKKLKKEHSTCPFVNALKNQ